MNLDQAIRRATEATACSLEQRSEEIVSGSLGEKPAFHEAFKAALRDEFGERVLSNEQALSITDWQAAKRGRKGVLGPIDVLVAEEGGRHVLFAELKWCWLKRELGWTLWDIYKLVAAQGEHTPQACYAIVAAPDRYWNDPNIDCAEVFRTGRWSSTGLFADYWRAWTDLLYGGSARPSRIPAEIATTLVADAQLEMEPPWSIRALRVAPDSEEWVPFDGDWPRGIARVDRHREDAPSRLERIRGCLLGGAVGDALGAPVEFLSLSEIRERFGVDGIGEFAEAYGRRGAFTDDTQMTLFTAEGLMRAHNRMTERGICSVREVVWNAYLRWLSTQGSGFERAVARAQPLDGWLVKTPELHSRRAPGNTCLSALAEGRLGSLDAPLNDSKGCGGVMRVAPVGILTPRDPFADGCELAALTHGHPSGFLAAGFLSSLIAKVVAGKPVWNAAVETLDELKAYDKVRGAECRKAVEAALTRASRDAPSTDDVTALGEGWVAEEALAIALYCSLTADDFPSGVRLAVNHGGDSDSTGAITGNILGAVFGASALPSSWLEGLEMRDVIEEVADDLARHAAGENVEEQEGGRGSDVGREDWQRYPGW